MRTARATKAAVPPAAPSLRRGLLLWLTLPLLLLLAANMGVAWRNAALAADVAYDRTLFVLARSIADGLQVRDGVMRLSIPVAATDLLEREIRGHLYYRVIDPKGRVLGGFEDLPPVPARVERSAAYATLVSFYDDHYRQAPIRVASLLQPFNQDGVDGIVTIQVAETLETRQSLVRSVLGNAFIGQLLLIALAGTLLAWGVRRALAPLSRMSNDLAARDSLDLNEFVAPGLYREVQPLVGALNAYVGRLRTLVDLRKRFIANAAHQLRTPLAVLKTQAAMARRETDPTEREAAMQAIGVSVDGAARLADQLLALTRAEHGLTPHQASAVDLTALARAVCFEWLDRAAAVGVDLGFERVGDSVASATQADPTLLSELIANLIDNALNYGRPPAGRDARVTVRVIGGTEPVIEVEDNGPGIAPSEIDKVFSRFYRVPGTPGRGSGLGLAIVREIAQAHGASLALQSGVQGGLRVRVCFERNPLKAA